MLHPSIGDTEDPHSLPNGTTGQVGILGVEEELFIEGPQLTETTALSEKRTAGRLLDADGDAARIDGRRETSALEAALDAEVPVEHRVRVDPARGEHRAGEERPGLLLGGAEERGDRALLQRCVRVEEDRARRIHDREGRVDRSTETVVPAVADEHERDREVLAQVRDATSVVDEHDASHNVRERCSALDRQQARSEQTGIAVEEDDDDIDIGRAT
ncbi:hypothetical protein DEJ34_02130 [Curtobacterium sp. MCPF17_050]|uniref:hypothetical protein n=1 Tax=Curtobacterium sp. MCPF17_050 TaxID=2175664 RepID=UPI0021AD4EF8|nr:MULTISPECIES: hypothetical protein [unclassified Curtobacterium]WIB15950.1 hypothetical protein DEJ34_02130 [Curtobacterium sp. MCPF17_050]